MYGRSLFLRRRWWVALVCSLATLAAVLPAGTAQASASRDPAGRDRAARGLAILRAVVNQPDAAQRFARLSPADRAAVDAVTVPAATALLESRVTPVAAATGARPVPFAGAAGGCWAQWQRWGAQAAAGNTVYTWWLGLTWCAANGSVTSYRVFDRGGETATLGWSFTGNGGSGSLNVGWEVRQYVQEKFEFGIGPVGFTNTRCAQIRGGATGLYSASASCGLS